MQTVTTTETQTSKPSIVIPVSQDNTVKELGAFALLRASAKKLAAQGGEVTRKN